MNKSDEEFYKELLNDFREEGAEHLQTIVNGLLDVEKDRNSGDKEMLETIFRETHSLKGAARALDLKNIESLCMAMESIMHKIKDGELEFSPGFFDGFFEATDILEVLLNEIGSTKQSVAENRITKITSKLKNLEQGKSTVKKPHRKKITSSKKESGPPAQEKTSHPEKEEPIKKEPETEHSSDEPKSTPDKAAQQQSESIRVSLDKLNEILYSAEELITSKAFLKFQVQQIDGLSREVTRLKRQIQDWMHGDSEEGKASVKKTSFTESLNKLDSDLAHSTRQLEELQRVNNRNVDDLNFKVRKAMMQPFSSMLSVIPRIVRDLSKEHEKEIELSMEGEHIEIDRRILEQMKDPLIHLIRNSIDHGIETTEERKKAGKNTKGHLTIKVSHEAGQKIGVTIQDDGKGLDHQNIINAAIKNKAVSQSEAGALTESQINQLIFASGVSTSPIITDVSGRGLGMAIVAEKINHLGGKILVDTTPKKGTTFRIELPQTLATFSGILVEASGQRFLLPTTSVFKAVKVSKQEIKPVESKNTFRFLNETISLVTLADVLGLRKSKNFQNKQLQVMIVETTSKTGFVVDKVLGEYEGMVKPLGRQLKHVNKMEGACFLGDGSVVPVLQVEELMEAARGVSSGSPQAQSVTADGEQKKVLYAEDSITVRNMVRSHIEAAGFEVSTAVDGQAAYELLQKEAFDLVVSDIEMPRMNGFELTSKIKKDNALSHLPVILVTSLDSKADRDRGLESGANAYIVKSSFEKSNLIDTIKRLI